MPGSYGSLQVPLLSSPEPSWAHTIDKVSSDSRHVYPAAAVKILAQDKEWGELTDSSASAESAVPDRKERYAAAAKELAATATQTRRAFATVSATAVVPGMINAGQVKGGLCTLFFVDMNMKLLALLMLLSVPENWLPTLGLSLAYIFIVTAQVQLALSDRSFLRARGEYWAKAKYVHYGISVILVVGALGILQMISLVRARRFFKSSKHAETIVSELDCRDDATGDGRGQDNIRVDCGAFFLAGFPLPFLGTWLFLAGRLEVRQPGVFVVATLTSAVMVVVACVGFDYQASRAIQWLWNSQPHTRGKRTRACHVLQRLCEVTARMLFGIAVVEVWPNRPSMIWLAVWIIDCVFAGYLATTVSKPARSQVVAAMVSALHFVADVSRYIDENGLARAAKRLSTSLARLRAVEVITVGACLLFSIHHHNHANSQPASRDSQSAEDVMGAEGRLCLLICMVLMEALSQLLSSPLCTLGKRRQQDLFTAAEADDCELLRYLLEQGNLMDKNARSRDYTAETPLHTAVVCGHVCSVELLLQDDADISLVDVRGNNALHAACLHGNWPAVELLLRGAKDSMLNTTRCSLASVVHRKNHQGKIPAELLPNSAPAHVVQLLSSLLHGKADTGSSAARNVEEPFVEEVDFAALNRLFGPELGRGHTRWRVDENCGMTQVESLTEHLFAQCVGERVGLIIEWRSESRKGRVLHVSTLTRVKTLGAGSFGKVIQVKDEATAEEYALKIQLRTHTQKQAIREAQALANLEKHPFVVRVMHIFHTRLYFGILMELCDTDLNRRIIEDADGGIVEGLREQEIAARYTLCMSLALHHLHTHGIIFRDLKPENVLVTNVSRGDHAKLTDFGLACRIERYERSASEASEREGVSSPVSGPDLHRWHSFAGTRGFMPQEVFEPPKVTRLDIHELTSRDWYALGCTLILMLFGETIGNKVRVSMTRSVLLPPHQDQMAAVLEEASRWKKACPDAIQLVKQLTEIEVACRGDFHSVCSNPFVQQALGRLEAESPPDVIAAVQPVKRQCET